MLGLKCYPFGRSLVLGLLLILVIFAALASTKFVERASAGYRGDGVLEPRTEQCNDGNSNWYDDCGKWHEIQYTCARWSPHELKKTRTLMGIEFEEYCYGSIRAQRKDSDAWVAGCFLYSGGNGIKELCPGPCGRRIVWANAGFLTDNIFNRKGALLSFEIHEDPDFPVLIRGWRATDSFPPDGYIELGEVDRDMVIMLRLEQPSTLTQLNEITQVVKDMVEASFAPIEPLSVQRGSAESSMLAGSEIRPPIEITRVPRNRPAAEPPSAADAQEGTKSALITRASHSSSAGTPETATCGGNLVITGNIRYAEPGCSDGAIYSSKTENIECHYSASANQSEPDIPTSSAACTDLPLRRARVELWSWSTFLFATRTDDLGDFEFCLNNAPNNPVDLYLVIVMCPDDSDDGDACGSMPGTPKPFSVGAGPSTDEIYIIDGSFSIAYDVCIGSVNWDITDRRANPSGAEHVYDLLANDAFDYFQTEVSWTNDKGLWVAFPDGPTTFSPSPLALHIAAGDEQDSDVILWTYADFLLYELYDHVFPEVTPACASHTWGAPSDVSCAMIHGSAAFLQAAMQNDPLFEDTPSPGAPPTTQIDLELPDPAVDAVFDEGAVAASLWDMFDSVNEPHDVMTLGLAPIWDLIDADRPDWMCSFLEAYEVVHGPSAELAEILDTHHVGCGMVVPDTLGSNLTIQTLIDSVVVPYIATGIDEHLQRSNVAALEQNFPNPFNPTTTISFSLSERGMANLSVYNIEGKLVTTLVDETLDAGFKEITWDGRDARGDQVSTGVYFCRLTAGDKTLTKKMVLLK